MHKTVKSSCRMCHGGCGVLITMTGDRVVRISGDPDNPINRGKLCPKAGASIELLYHPNRIRHPLKRKGKRGDANWARISWDGALDEMAGMFAKIKRESGPEHLAMMHGTSRPYTDLAARFCNAFGTPNYTGITHLCYGPRLMATAFTAGTMQVPMPDIHGLSGHHPACLLIWGNNTVDIGAAQGVYGMALESALESAREVIVVDPRRTTTAKKATLWLALRPGTDGALALAMINVMVQEELYDRQFVARRCSGFEQLAEHVRKYTPAWAGEITGLPVEQITLAARIYAETKPASLVWGNAIDQGPSGFQTARALFILRGITGNLDRPGGDVFWQVPEGILPKSPFVNGELAGKHYLPSEMHRLAVDNLSRRRRPVKPDSALSGANGVPGISSFNATSQSPSAKSSVKTLPELLKATAEVRGSRYPLNMSVHLPAFWESIITGLPYRVKGLWIMGTNPLITHPRPQQVASALGKLDYLVASDMFMTPTAKQADLVLPAASWLEQNDVVNQFKQWCVVARRKVAQTGLARDDREVIIELAHRLGLDFAFPWKNWRAFLDQMVRGTGQDFDGFCRAGVLVGDQRYQKYESEGFNTPSRKLEIFSPTLAAMGIEPLPVYREPLRSPVSDPQLAQAYPLILTTGAKMKHFFHSEYRQLSLLRRHRPQPRFEIHPQTAAEYGIADGHWAFIETPEGKAEMMAVVTENILRGIISAEHGWWFPEEDNCRGLWRSNVNELFGVGGFDPDTGAEPLRSTLCRVHPKNDGA